MMMIDRIIEYLSPAWAWRRQQARARLRAIKEANERPRPDPPAEVYPGWLNLDNKKTEKPNIIKMNCNG